MRIFGLKLLLAKSVWGRLNIFTYKALIKRMEEYFPTETTSRKLYGKDKMFSNIKLLEDGGKEFSDCNYY